MLNEGFPRQKKKKKGAKNEVAGKTETGFTSSDLGEEESEELKEAVMEQVNELGAKIEEARKPET